MNSKEDRVCRDTVNRSIYVKINGPNYTWDNNKSLKSHHNNKTENYIGMKMKIDAKT